jgi:spore coat polysaccharide biosynthesis protein SpsF
MENFKTEQELFWAGDFGKQYISRNMSDNLLASNTAHFAKVLSKTINIKSVIEFGSNVGMNLLAIQHLLPNIDLAGIEINEQAANILIKNIPKAKVYQQSIIDFNADYKRDIVICKTVLIHINPDFLQNVYKSIYNSTNRYIYLAEYYNPVPVAVSYRGHSDKLFKRDFAGEFMDKYPDVKLIDYGFLYHRDNNFKQDDINWFLIDKSAL